MQMPSAAQNRKGGVTCEQAIIISKEYEENNEHSAGRERNAGEIIQENDGIPEKSRAGSQQKENEPAHDQEGVIAYDEQKRFF
mgnify:CR=1 FL=1